MIVTILGSCANQTLNREGTSVLIESESSNLLIDCGPGIAASFGRAGRKTSDINNVLLTHVHGDHSSGFAYFVWNRNFERLGQQPASDPNVFGSADTIELTKFSLEHTYPELKFPFKIIYHELSSDKEDSFNVEKLSVHTIPANHAVPCLSCCVSDGNKKVVYSSDTLLNQDLLKFDNPDLLIHEGMMTDEFLELSKKVKHSLSSQAGEFATKVQAKQLALVHIAPSLLGKESALIQEASKNYSGPITIPFDGTVYGI